jgi:beta-phosphoglucomutase-like phosphatase (HAD superfamily)
MGIAALIFDFNGVLANDEYEHWQAARAVLEPLAVDLPEETFWKDYVGVRDEEMFADLITRNETLSKQRTVQKLTQDKVAVYRERFMPTIKPYTGIAELLIHWSTKVPLVLVSGARRSNIESLLTQWNLLDCFQAIWGGDDVRHGKPHPEGYLLAKAWLKKNHPQVDLSQTWVVEDSPAGVHAARGADFPVIAISHTAPISALGEAQAWVQSVEELSTWLNTHLRNNIQKKPS